MHVSLEANGREELLGKVRNYAMLPAAEYADAYNEGFDDLSPQQNAYVVELQDPEHIAALMQPRVHVCVSFACVESACFARRVCVHGPSEPRIRATLSLSFAPSSGRRVLEVLVHLLRGDWRQASGLRHGGLFHR
jgi:hypothetical protein